jgi:hypothetical protein
VIFWTGTCPPAESGVVPPVVMQVAGQVGLHRHAGLGEDLLAQVDEVGLVEHLVDVAVLLRVDPHRHRQTQDHLVAWLHVAGGDLAEVLDLRHVEVALQLAVAAHQPPAVRQLQHEVAAALARPPAGEAPAADVRAEQPRERRQAVVPVVVAWHGVDVRPLRRHGVAEGGGIRRDQPALVFLTARRRIHLVAAEHQHVAARQRDRPARAVHQQRRLGHRVGDGVGRIEAVAGVAREVDPQLVARSVAARLGSAGAVAVVNRVVVVLLTAGGQRLHDAAVAVLADDQRDQALDAGAQQLPGIEPPHHRHAGVGAAPAAQPQREEHRRRRGDAPGDRHRRLLMP